MQLKSEPIAPSDPAPMPAPVCANCGAEERRLLLHVRQRSDFRRLCATCVLRIHSQDFCPSCLQVYSSIPPPNDAVRICVRCGSRSHSHCAATAPPSTSYVCPLCVNPNAPLFELKPADENGCRVMDRDAARMLLAAAKIACASMNKAAVSAKVEAEKRVKEAAGTRKRAKEALEHVTQLMMKARREEDVRGNAGNGFRMKTNSGVRNGNVGMRRPFGNAAGNVDRDRSNHVLSVAMNAVELSARGEGAQGNDMDVVDGGMLEK